MKQQKKFWIRENQSIGIWTFLGCIGACLQLSLFRSSVEDIWRNFYYVEQYYMEISNTAFGRFLSYSRVFYSTMAVYVLILSILLFHNLSRSKTKEWIASLPLKQKDIFWYKFRQGRVAYTLPL
ncbi:MAG: hypothetical protein MJ087_04725 [Lachnospiraceae bacterium]|nr:hypothetical protein [Lachnospiraceae bacterium]